MLAIEVRRLSGSIGAEILGIDLASYADNAIGEIRQVWLEHNVIFFRDRGPAARQVSGVWLSALAIYLNISSLHQRHRRLSGYHPRSSSSSTRRRISAERAHRHRLSRDTADGDHFNRAQVPPHGGDTPLRHNTYRAYETLSEGMKRMLDGLIAVKSFLKG